jgi:hypothetical protein
LRGHAEFFTKKHDHGTRDHAAFSRGNMPGYIPTTSVGMAPKFIHGRDTQLQRAEIGMTRKLRLSLLIAGGLAVLVALTLLGLFGLHLAAQHEPDFYREAMATDPEVLEKASDRMLHEAAALQSAVSKQGRWEALFTAEQINGWLAVDRAKNHPNSLPPTMSDPRVAIDSKQITFACRYEEGGASRVLSLTIEPQVPEPNVLALRIVKARAGLLPLPLGKVLDALSEAARNLHLHLEWRRAGEDPVAMISLPEEEDEPTAQIDTLRLGDGEIFVAGSTGPRNP